MYLQTRLKSVVFLLASVVAIPTLGCSSSTGSGGGGAGGTSGTSGPSGPSGPSVTSGTGLVECITDAQCPLGYPYDQCGKAACLATSCDWAPLPGSTGKKCYLNGAESPAGVCSDTGNCVACIGDSGCTGESTCQTNQYNRCVGPQCVDGVKNGNESDVDCGVDCAGCADGKACSSGASCASGVCLNQVCAAPTCLDMVKNNGESDVDCGGACATKCALGKRCQHNTDCAGAPCFEGACQPRTCHDFTKNGDEPDVDCGGSCKWACPYGAHCNVTTDCVDPSVCIAGACELPS